jgi:HEPN domain-containing protein
LKHTLDIVIMLRLDTRGVAQFGLARLHGVQEAGGSNPLTPTILPPPTTRPCRTEHDRRTRGLSDSPRYWIERVEYDLETAKAMLQTGRYLYVGFMCQQVIEKALKAVIARGGVKPPRIHNLARLAELAGILEQMSEEQLSVLDSLEPMHIEGRYPGDSDHLARTLNTERCTLMLAQTEELCKWIRAK